MIEEKNAGGAESLESHLAALEKENRMLRLENTQMKMAMERSSLYNLTKDRLIEVVTAEKTKQEKFMGRLLENSPDIILTLDRQYRFVNCTDVFLRSAGIADFGLIKNLTVFDVFSAFAPDTAAKMRTALEGLCKTDDTVIMGEVLDIGKNGRPRHYEIHITKMFERGEPDGAILLLIDITDVIRAKEELETINAAMKELIANISHDLRTPLTVMSVNLEELSNLVRAYGGGEELIGKVGAAWRKNLDLQRITQNLLEVSRIETGRSIYNPDWVSVSELMLKVQDRYEDYLEDKALYLNTAYGKDMSLWLDEQKIWSVFDNVIYNAVRYTAKGGISITAAEDGANATVIIRDTGSGVAPADLPHIFERFYKASGARGGMAGDSGLGLYIVKSIMEAFEGSVSAKSAPGKGTSVILTFKRRAQL